MRILIGCMQSGGVTWYLRGIGNAFASIECTDVRYMNLQDPSVAPLDVFAQFNPDIYIGYGYSSLFPRALQKAIKIYKPKTLLYVPAHPKSEAGKIKKNRPDLIYDVATPQDIKVIEDNSNFIDSVFIHHHRSCADGYLEGWSVPYCGIGMACDIIAYQPGKWRPEYDCDASMISGYWEYKARKLKPWVFPLVDRCNLKIWGNGRFPLINYLGTLPESEVSDVWASTKINLQIHEPQSELGWEVSERTFKVVGTGNFLISDYVDALGGLYFRDDELLMANTPEEYQEKVIWCINHPETRQIYINKSQKRVLSDHTYHDRAIEILKILFQEKIEEDPMKQVVGGGIGNLMFKLGKSKHDILAEKFNQKNI